MVTVDAEITEIGRERTEDFKFEKKLNFDTSQQSRLNSKRHY